MLLKTGDSLTKMLDNSRKHALASMASKLPTSYRINGVGSRCLRFLSQLHYRPNKQKKNLIDISF